MDDSSEAASGLVREKKLGIVLPPERWAEKHIESDYTRILADAKEKHTLI